VLSFTYDELIHFLLHAKRQMCAHRGNEVGRPSLLPGSQEIEYYEAPFFYRNVSFGTNYMVGQETIYFREFPAWSMSFCGGVIPENIEAEETCLITDFLRQALPLVTYERPYRGPQFYHQGLYRYLDSTQGNIIRFRGEEIIVRGDKRVYELRYGGGILN
jgi:hypothetical protein